MHQPCLTCWRSDIHENIGCQSRGISKIMKAILTNGSPSAEFETDHEHFYFLIRLPVHEKTRTPESCFAPTSKASAHHLTPHVRRLLRALERRDVPSGIKDRSAFQGCVSSISLTSRTCRDDATQKIYQCSATLQPHGCRETLDR